MEITIGQYNVKKDLVPALNIPMNQVTMRKKELLAWFENFFEFEVVKIKPLVIEITDIIGEYQPLPRKKYDTSAREQKESEKKTDYESYTIASLGTEYKPNSIAKISRDAVKEFSKEKYGHKNAVKVAERYVSEPFKKHAVTNDNNVWVYCKTYLPLEENILEEWRTILLEEHISEKEAANAFYKQQQGQDISKEKQYYKNAMNRFKDKYDDVPVLVKEWKAGSR